MLEPKPNLEWVYVVFVKPLAQTKKPRTRFRFNSALTFFLYYLSQLRFIARKSHSNILTHACTQIHIYVYMKCLGKDMNCKRAFTKVAWRRQTATFANGSNNSKWRGFVKKVLSQPNPYGTEGIADISGCQLSAKQTAYIYIYTYICIENVV